MKVRDFELGTTAERDALILTTGEVPKNHAQSLGRILRYDAERTHVISASELVKKVPDDMIGLVPNHAFNVHRIDARRMRKEAEAFSRRSAAVIGEYVTAQFALAPGYDVHVIDGLNGHEDRSFDQVLHWKLIGHTLHGATRRAPRSKRALNWRYESFNYDGKSLDQAFGQWSELNAAQKTAQLARYIPDYTKKHFFYAAAKLKTARGTLRSAEVEFGHPPTAWFTHSRQASPHERDEYGDVLLSLRWSSEREDDRPLPKPLQDNVGYLTREYAKHHKTEPPEDFLAPLYDAY